MSENSNESVYENPETQTVHTPDENEQDAPDSGVADEVVVDGPAKLAHEDLAATQEQIDDEETETRSGEDFEGQPAAAELREEREDESRDEE